MKTFQQLLKELRACSEAREWACEKEIEEVVETCDRGDWLLWLAKKVDVDNRKLTLAKGLCANTVRHLMKDKRSIRAVDTAIAYGKWEVGIEELTDAASSATHVVDAATYASYYAASHAAYYNSYYTAYYSAYYAAYYAAYATSAASAASAVAAYASAAASAVAYVTSDSDAAKKANQMQTANICREVIGQEIIEKVNELLN